MDAPTPELGTVAAMDPTPLRFTLQPDELARAMVEHTPKLRTGRRRCLGMGLFLVAYGAVALTVTPIAGTIALTAGGMFLLANSRWLFLRRYRAMVAGTPGLTLPATITAEADGIRITNDTSDCLFRWTAYQSLVHSDQGVGLILRGRGGVRWIPARAFESTEHKASWCEQVGLVIAGQVSPA